MRSLMLCLLLAAGSAWGLDGTAILAQVDRNLTPDSYEMYRKLINQEPDGSRKEFVLYTAKQGRESMVALFLAPASEVGRTTLRPFRASAIINAVTSVRGSPRPSVRTIIFFASRRANSTICGTTV